VPEFTVDWFDARTPQIGAAIQQFRDRPAVRMLEIGAYEGRSTIWYLDHILTGPGSHLTTVDHWRGSAENDPAEMLAVHDRFCRNTARYVAEGRLTVVTAESQVFLASRVAERGQSNAVDGYHIVYLDGSHAAPDVLSDAVMAWALLESGGILIFDDYLWTGLTTEQDRPRFAVDSFLACFLGQYDEVYRGYQMIIHKRGGHAIPAPGPYAPPTPSRGVVNEQEQAAEQPAARRQRGKRIAPISS
jgi:predicted O-methyltransferase YrrM